MFVVFAANGALNGSWTPRVPALAARVAAGPGVLGLALLAMTAGMLLVAPVAGRLAERFGARAVVVTSTLVSCAILPPLGLAGSVLALGVLLFGLGLSLGTMEVAMNVGGVAVERRAGRPLLSLLHAGYSVGGFAGSAAAGLAAGHHWPPSRHLAVVAAVAIVVLLAVCRGVPAGAAPADRPERPRVALVKRPVLWLLGGIVVFSAIAEGASADWSALLLVTRHGAGEGVAALAYTAFSLAMAVSRFGGSWAQRRFGAIRLLVTGALVAGTGLALAALVPSAGVALAGFVLAGAGLSTSFPVALSLAGSAGHGGGEREVAFVSTIAYGGFLAGPPLVGGIAQATSLSVSFVVVGLLAALIAPAAVSARRRAPQAASAQ